MVRFDLKVESVETFDRLVDETVRQIHDSEPGTLAYLVHGTSDTPASRVFYELYRDREAFEEHEARPHVKRFLAERGQYLVLYVRGPLGTRAKLCVVLVHESTVGSDRRDS